MKEICEVRRTRTSTPLQALVLLNDPQIMEASRVLGSALLVKYNMNGKDAIQHAFRLITSRMAKANELDILDQFYAAELKK